MNEERKPLWPWICALVVGLPVVYVASFGPACQLVDRKILSMSAMRTVFGPCLDLALDGSPVVQNALWSWADICGGEDTLFEEFVVKMKAKAKIQQLKSR